MLANVSLFLFVLSIIFDLNSTVFITHTWNTSKTGTVVVRWCLFIFNFFLLTLFGINNYRKNQLLSGLTVSHKNQIFDIISIKVWVVGIQKLYSRFLFCLFSKNYYLTDSSLDVEHAAIQRLRKKVLKSECHQRKIKDIYPLNTDFNKGINPSAFRNILVSLIIFLFLKFCFHRINENRLFRFTLYFKILCNKTFCGEYSFILFWR